MASQWWVAEWPSVSVRAAREVQLSCEARDGKTCATALQIIFPRPSFTVLSVLPVGLCDCSNSYSRAVYRDWILLDILTKTYVFILEGIGILNRKNRLNLDVRNRGVIGVIQRWFRLIKKKGILGKVVWATFNWILLPSPVVIVCNFNCVGLWLWYKAWGLLLVLNLQNTLIDYREISPKVVRALVWSKYKPIRTMMYHLI